MSRYSETGAEVVAHLPASIVDGFTAAFASALREGVGVEKLDGLLAWATSKRHIFTDSVEDQRTVLTERLKAVRADLKVSERQAKRSKLLEDKDAWGDQANEERGRLRRLRAELDALDIRAKQALPDEFDSEVDFLLVAAKNMSENKGAMPREMVHDIATVMPERVVRICPDSRIQVEVHVRLPMDGGVARVGPIRWFPADQPELSVGLMWAAREVAGEDAPWLRQRRAPRKERPQPRRGSAAANGAVRDERRRRRGERPVHLEEIEEAGASRAKALTLLACPFPAAVPVVLAAAAGDPAPDWVGEDWADPTWMAWMHACYLGTDRETAHGGRWSGQAWLRQLIIDVASDHDGRVTQADLQLAVAKNGLSPTALSRLLRPGGPKPGRNERSWPPPVDRWGQWPAVGQAVSRDLYGVELKTCQRCGRPAEVATRVNEVFGDLLCPEGHMLDVETTFRDMFGEDLSAAPDPATVTVPAEYQWLRAPRRAYQWRLPPNSFGVEAAVAAALKLPKPRRAFRPMTDLSSVERAALVARYVDGGLSAADVGAEFGLSHASANRLLQAEGVLRSRSAPRRRRG